MRFAGSRARFSSAPSGGREGATFRRLAAAGGGGALAVYHWVLAVNAVTAALTLLLAILFISTLWGLAEATVASIAAVLGFNYFFLEPIGTLTIQDPQNIVAFVAFLITAVTASQLSAYARRRTAEAESGRLEMERLHALVQTMMPRGSAQHRCANRAGDVMQAFGCSAAAFYYQPGGEVFRSVFRTASLATP